MRSRKLLGELLLEAGLLTAAQLELALTRQRESGHRLGQILVSTGHISEEQLVETLSRQLQIAVAPEARLRQVRPPQQALRMVPAELARKQRLLPIFFNEQEQSLSLVMADPQDLSSLTLIKQKNNLARLRVLLASDRLLDELISIHYGSDSLTEAAEQSISTRHPHVPRPPLLLIEPEDRHAQALGSWLGLEGYSVLLAKEPSALERMVARTPDALVVARQGLEDPALAQAMSMLPPDRVRRIPPARELLEESGATARFVDFYLKTLDFFFSLLEEDKEAPSQRHLRQVSQMSRMVAQRLGLPTRQIDAVAIAGYLYQFGDFLTQRGIFGQTVSPDTSLAMTAELWSSFQPPLPVASLLKGLSHPHDPVQEGEIGTAILRAVGTYLEMRDGSRGHARIGHEKALRYLQEHRDSRFSPRVVDTLQELLAKEHLLDQLEVNGATDREVLLVDKDRISIQMLELRFVREGFRVRTARTGEEALRMIEAQRPTLIISEITLPKVDGFELCARLKGDPAMRDIPFIFLSSRADTYHVTKGLELGGDDFLTKPINLDILMSKVRRLERVLESQRQVVPSGVQGSLSEMGLFDLLQVLQLGMKSARVTLTRGQHRCELFLDKGSLVYAAMGDRKGQEAFFDLCTWDSGTFAVSPGNGAPERNLHESNDFLLMEGMRRADELFATTAQNGNG